jgi:5-formyltetrahydrofolate cyclo-ligase
MSKYKTEIRAQIAPLGSSELQQVSGSVREKLESWELYRQAESVGLYLAMNDEIAVDQLIDCSKKIFLPRYNSSAGKYEMAEVVSADALVAGKYGIKEPSAECRQAEINEIALWLIPAVAFDRNGNRLGRGGGFYDRLLENEKGIKVGIAHSLRIVEELPVEDWDIKMDFVITEKETININ